MASAFLSTRRRKARSLICAVLEVVVVVLFAAGLVVAGNVGVYVLVVSGKLQLDPVVGWWGRVERVAATANRGLDSSGVHFSGGGWDINQVRGFHLGVGPNAGNDASVSSHAEK